MSTRQVHVVPEGSPPGRDHTPWRTCWCGPQYLGHDLSEPGLLVFRHRTPPPPPPREPRSQTYEQGHVIPGWPTEREP